MANCRKRLYENEGHNDIIIISILRANTFSDSILVFLFSPVRIQRKFTRELKISDEFLGVFICLFLFLSIKKQNIYKASDRKQNKENDKNSFQYSFRIFFNVTL